MKIVILSQGKAKKKYRYTVKYVLAIQNWKQLKFSVFFMFIDLETKSHT